MGSPPPRPSPPGLGEGRGRLAVPWEVGTLVSRLLAAGLSWPSRSPSSPFGAAPASVSVASVSRDSLSASLSLLSRSLVPRRPAVGQEEPGWGRRPLGRAWFRVPGKWEPWTAGDARSPQHPRGAAGEDETAALLSAIVKFDRKIGEDAGRGGGAQLGSAGRGVPWQRVASAAPTPISIPSTSPPPHPGSVGPHTGLQGFGSDPPAAPSMGELTGGMEEPQIQLPVILRAECQQPRANSAGRNQDRLPGGGSRCPCCGSVTLQVWQYVLWGWEDSPLEDFIRARHVATEVDPAKARVVPLSTQHWAPNSTRP